MKKLVIGGAVGAVLLVAAVWVGFDLFLVEKVDPAPPPSKADSISLPPFTEIDADSVPPDIVAFLEVFAAEVRAGEATKAAGRFDTTRLYVIAAGHDISPDQRLPRLIGGQLPHLYSAVLGAFGSGGFGLPWDRIEILNAKEISGLLVANVRHSSGDHVVPARWWLAKTPKGHVAVDVEDLRIGLRLSHQFALLLSIENSVERKLKAGDAVRAFSDASSLLVQDKPREADAALGPAKRTPMPPVQNKAALALEGLAAAALGQADRAETIAAALGDLPAAKLIRAISKGGDETLVKRLAAAHSYETSFGPTPLTISVRIQSLMAERKDAEAADLVEDGLKRYPDSPTLLAWSTVLFN